MKYERVDRFIADWSRLPDHERTLFKVAVRAMNESFARREANQMPRWSAALRATSVSGAHGVWELTWSFSGPDGRATFEFINFEGEPTIRWRRISDHRIFDAP